MRADHPAARTAALLCSRIDALNRGCGEALVRLMPLVVALAASVVVLRYAFRIGLPWLSETYVWLNGAIFMLGAGYVLLKEGHVRVDVFYRRAGPRARAVVDISGVCLLLWPTLFVVLSSGMPAVLRSWRSLEASPSIDGLPFLYLLKTCIPLFCVLVALQGLSIALRGVLTLCGHPPESEAESRG